MFKPNIGTLNALIRITIGLAVVSFATARLVRTPWRVFPKLMIWIGAMRVAEGIVRFCPITEVCKLSRYLNVTKCCNHDTKEDATPNKNNATKPSSSYNASDEKMEAKIASDILGI
ncbi:DUF2892 domain-containing protein [Ectobacillus polymachus]|uniref:YgaP family membrane protein n=1 Tax=Ectobacillus polymachus TaxID=1508806 RepID=UPI003A87C69F